MTQPPTTRGVLAVEDAEGPIEFSPAFRRSLAVIIGINDYGNGIPRLETPVNDADQIAAILERDQHFVIQTKLTSDVTRAKLATLFSETLPALNLDHRDRLLVYFAGHGVSMQGEDGEPEYFLVPQDARAANRDSFLPMRDVREWLLQLDSRHLLLMLDCCFAGGFGRMRALDNPPPVIYRQRYNFYVRSAAWQVIASAAHDETALDTAGGFVFGRRYTGETPDNSPFALALFDALSGQADANPPTHPGEPNGDGLITVTELLSFVRDRVQGQADEISHRQTPALWSLLPKHQAGEYFFGNPQRVLQLLDAPALTADTNPYRGLSSYEEQQSELFFGRAKQIQKLNELAVQQSFLAVLGASGTGKSSLVKAGLVPVLKQSAASPNPCLVLPPLRPTNEPLPALETMLATQLPAYQTHAQNFAADENALAVFVTAWREQNVGQRLVLVIDQFEELVTLCDETERKQFQTLIVRALDQHADALCVILTLRTDFEPSFANGPLQEFWRAEGARYIVPPLTQDDLRQVIVGPALKREVYFESSALVETLINEVIQTPGGLPLLSFTLSEMYLQYIESGRQDRTLSQEEYRAVGGVIGSLRNAANKVYKELEDDHHRSMMERVMLRMVAIEGGEVARRRVSTAELDYGAQENPIRQNVVDMLTNARLVVNSGEGNTKWTEPAHDALISGWDRLMEWKLRAAPYLPLQRELAPAALRWQAAKNKQKIGYFKINNILYEFRSGLLWYDDPRLPQLQETLQRTKGKKPQHKSQPIDFAVRDNLSSSQVQPTDTTTDAQWLNQPETAFVKASISLRRVIFRGAVGITLLVILILSVLTLIANLNANEANKQKNTAETEVAVRKTEVVVRETAQAEAVTQAAVANSQQKTAEANAAEARRQANKSQSKSLTVASTALRQESLAASVLLGVEAINADANYETLNNLFTALENTHRLITFGALDGSVDNIVFSSDGNTVASVSGSGDLRLWDLRHPQAPHLLLASKDGQKVPSVALNPDGKTIATIECTGYECDAGKIKLRDISDPTHPQVLDIAFGEGNGKFLRVAFNSNGKVLVSQSIDKTIQLWDMSDVAHPEALGSPLTGSEGSQVWSFALNPNGDTLALGGCSKVESDGSCSAGEIRLWDVNDPAHPTLLGAPLTGSSDGVSGVAFSPTGNTLVSGNILELFRERSIQLWDVSDVTHPKSLGELFKDNGADPLSFAFSSDGNTLAVGNVWDSDNHLTLRMWDVSDAAHPKTLEPLDGGEGGHFNLIFAFRPNHNSLGYSICTAQDQNYGTCTESEIWLWNLSHAQAIGAPLARQTDVENKVAFSPDGNTLFVWGGDNTISSWNVRNLAHPQALGTLFAESSIKVLSVAFNREGNILATGGCSKVESNGYCRAGEIQLWDVSDAAHPSALGAPLTGHTSGVDHIAFSPDGYTLVSESCGNLGYACVPFCGTYGDPGCTKGEIRLWDVRDVMRPLALGAPVMVDMDVQGVAFNHDGKMLFISGSSIKGPSHSDFSTALLDVWDVQDLSRPQKLVRQSVQLQGEETSVVFSPDSNTVASGACIRTAVSENCQAGGIWLWNVRNPAHPQILGQPLMGHSQDVTSLAFSRNSKTLASASKDGTIRFWDVQDAAQPKPLGEAFAGHTASVNGIVFSPDGKTLASGSRDNIIGLWSIDLDPKLLVERACLLAYRNLTRAEYARYINSDAGVYDSVYAKNPTCPGLPVEPLPTPTPTQTP